jgi:hypothetical protein
MTESARPIRYDELGKLLGLYRYLHPEDPDVREREPLESLWKEIYQDIVSSWKTLEKLLLPVPLLL